MAENRGRLFGKFLLLALSSIALLVLALLMVAQPVTPAISNPMPSGNELVFSIPLGENGIHYNVDQPTEDMLTWGPTSLYVAPDRTFWLIDGYDMHLLQFSPEGKMLQRIKAPDTMISMTDLVVTSQSMWVMDSSALPPKIVQFSLAGEALAQTELPTGFHLENGLSGLAINPSGELVVEMGSEKSYRFQAAEGRLEATPSEGRAVRGQPLSLGGVAPHSLYIQLGDQQIKVKSETGLYYLAIVQINPKGDFYVEMVEFTEGENRQVDRRILHFDAQGQQLGVARLPTDQYGEIRWNKDLATGPDGALYFLYTQLEGAEVQRLIFRDTLPSIFTSLQNAPPEGPDFQTVPPGAAAAGQSTCRNVYIMMEVADSYVTNSTYIDSFHINSSNANCAGRGIPRYLSTPKNYSSVSYAYGLWDTVEDFNSYMQASTNVPYPKFAGNINELLTLSCGRGIDCSGLVSRAWGLASHTGTGNLPNISFEVSTSHLQPGDILVKSGSPGHAILFEEYADTNKTSFQAYESVVAENADMVIYHTVTLSTLKSSSYTPWRYRQACRIMTLPIQARAEVPYRTYSAITSPYPAPGQNLAPQPYP